MVYDALSRNCYRVFTPIQFKFSRSDNPQLQDIPNGSSCSGGSDSCKFPPIPLLQDLGRGKPLQSSLKPILFQSRRGATPKIWAEGSKRGALLVSHPSSWLREKSLGICRSWWQNSPCLRREQIPSGSSALPAQQGTAQAELHWSPWDYLPLVVFFL